jgi:hypothetical protein
VGGREGVIMMYTVSSLVNCVINDTGWKLNWLYIQPLVRRAYENTASGKFLSNGVFTQQGRKVSIIDLEVALMLKREKGVEFGT